MVISTQEAIIFTLIVILVITLVIYFLVSRSTTIQKLKEQNRLIRQEVKQLQANILAINKTNKLQDEQIKALNQLLEKKNEKKEG